MNKHLHNNGNTSTTLLLCRALSYSDVVSVSLPVISIIFFDRSVWSNIIREKDSCMVTAAVWVADDIWWQMLLHCVRQRSSVH